MASSDDEGESVPHNVSNYYFVDDKNEPISFSELPIQENEGENPDAKRKQIFLHGTTDHGLQKVYKQVTAWKFDISNIKPEILVLSKENNWIKLQKPRKSFEDIIRTILITVHCLHFFKKNPEMSGRSLWDHLSRVFSTYEDKPAEKDLVDHKSLISEAIKRDEELAKSKVLITLLEEKPGKRKALDEDVGSTSRPGFIVEDDMIDEAEEFESDEEDDLFDSVCSICDNGGELLCCEGKCMRSFHATVEAGSESMCKSLGLSDEQVEAIQNFFCKNCQHKQHQCFSCGELGSSDTESGAAEVFHCVSATCGRSYHPHCVAKLLHRENEADAEELQKKIAAGERFTCPLHKCYVCKQGQGEEKSDTELQMAICRRCPKAYHRKCLPRKIAFEDLEDEGIIQRAWEGLIPNRILIYCLKHEIDDEIGTPIRNHIIFPKVGEKKKIKQASNLLSNREKVAPRDRSLASEGAPGNRTFRKSAERVEKLSSAIKEGDSSKKNERRSSALDSLKKQKVIDTSKKKLNRTGSTKLSKTAGGEGGPSLGERLYALVNKGSEQVKSRREGTPDSEHEQTVTVKPVTKEASGFLPLDADASKRIMGLMKEASSSITLEQIMRKHKVPETHAYSSKHGVDKTITLGKVEASIEALRAALQKLEEGCSIEDAKAVCEPGLLNQINRWRGKLRVYLAPFLYGMRYTSFGRHFTKVDKLKEIADILHWYAQDGDMIVDFCCGANDFSCLVKKKLDERGRKCSYKNYDLYQAKNDFNFEKRDWMSVRTKELPSGSQLIMGLNPPFGVNASRANQFIDKALEFKPKLIVLIVPPETQRLDKKDPPYDLILEDDELLAGNSFYFPGSVDINDKPIEQWNNTPPPLYLWSRPDWTSKHKAIAQQQGHLSRVREEPRLEENNNETMVDDFPLEAGHDLNGKSAMLVDYPPVQAEPEQIKEREASVTDSLKEGLPCNTNDRETHKSNGYEKNQLGENQRKRRRGNNKGKRGRGSGEAWPKDGESARSSPVSKKYKGGSRQSPSKVAHGKSLDGHPPEKLDRRGAGSYSQHRTGNGGTQTDDTGVSRHSSPKGSRGQSLHGQPTENFDHIGTGSHSQRRTGYGGNQTDDKGVPWRSPPKETRGKSSGGHPLEHYDCRGAGSYSEFHAQTDDIVPRDSPPKVTRGKSSDGHPPDYFDHRGTGSHFGTGYGGTQTDDVVRKYLNTEEPYTGMTQRWSGPSDNASPAPEYAIRNSGEPFSGYGRESHDNHAYGPYGSEMNNRYGRDTDVRSQLPIYGRKEPDLPSQRNGHFPGQDPPFGYGHHLGPAVDPSFTRMNTSSTSAMQRYAPKLNELNHSRMNQPGFEPPSLNRNGKYNPLAPPPGSVYRADQLGFAPGPYRPHPQQNNSSGWINE